ncbi:hypothetical protein PHISCL_02013 [Aspergillus sclerotialis]|uniref:Type 1 phosphatases regulator n=1 Tax=Aspergillus sclerotialis TaxID=2070753 RepID=A0A3A2ZSB5_9EURO|nr:hypothetical protein PHISCL_02013 [Aspergillus sclerotialis]
MSRIRQIPSNVASRSQLQTVPQATNDPSTIRIPGTLRLRGENNVQASNTNQEAVSARHIRWSEDVIDNEGMGKKSSKVCCIYHRPRPVGESSSESESSESSSSDISSDDETGQGNRLSNRSDHERMLCPEHTRHASEQQSMQRGRESCRERHRTVKQHRKPSPNAYEKMPRARKRQDNNKQG